MATRKSPVNCTLDPEIRDWAKEEKINLSEVLEQGLKRLKAKRTAEQRRAEKAAARRVGGQGFAHHSR